MSLAPVIAWTCEGPGTCVPGCESHGLCHCGCGAPTALAPQDRTAKGHRRGMPYRYVRHHSPLQIAGFDETKGVRLEEVTPWISAMMHEGMTVAAISRSAGISESHIWKCLRGYVGQRFVHRKTAARIKRAYERLDRHLSLIQVPMEPLREFFAANDMSPTSIYPKSSYAIRQFYRATTSYLSADEMAVTAGAHPSEIWEDWWDYEPPPPVPAKRAPTRRRDCRWDACFRRPQADGYCEVHTP